MDAEEDEVKAQIEAIADVMLSAAARFIDQRVPPGTPRFVRYLRMRAATTALGREFADAIKEDEDDGLTYSLAMTQHLANFIVYSAHVHPLHTTTPIGPVQ
jgi:hypothetical protein